MNRPATLTQQVKQKITSRIILGSALFICMFIATTVYDLYENMHQLSISLNTTSNELSKFITNQKLIDNEEAIFFRLKRMSKGAINFQWISPNNKFVLTHKTFNKILLSPNLSWNYFYKIPKVGLENIGSLKISGSILKDAGILRNFFIRGGILILFFTWSLIILYPIARKIPEELFVVPIRRIFNILQSSQEKMESQSVGMPLAIELQAIQMEILNLLEKNKMQSQKEAVLSIATQVAHDIRSPLAVINTALNDISSVQEEKRILIRNAIKRINDIANYLLLNSKGNTNLSKDITDSNVTQELAFVILENLVCEKRYEYSNRDIKINLNISSCSYDSFVRINIGLFKQVLSNLINNSIESINSSGSVSLNLSSNDKNIIISINDNGCGIPEEILSKITNHGFSFNKKNGAGLGLSHAKEYIEQLKGEFFIHSKLNVGTNVTIQLLKCEYPIWFCRFINLQEANTIVVLDDDPYIHEAWNKRLNSFSNVNLIHFSSASELTQEKIVELEPTTYLIDYELLPDNQNGLNIIERMKIDDQTILVTNSFEDLNIRKQCEELGVQIVPKPYVPFIPIIKISPSVTDNKSLVLIDNNKSIRIIWELAAVKAGLTITTYSSPFEFANDFIKHSKNTVIYIDSDLGENIKGELYAKDLYEKGFSEIYLTTGYQSSLFDNMPWIKSIIGKEPPFYNKQS